MWCDELALPISHYARRVNREGQSASTSKEYAEPQYWENRFQQTEGTFDWYATYEELGIVLREFCPPSPEMDVLMVGCGNSALSYEMFEGGYKKITNIDIASAAVAKMADKYKELDMKWEEMDATAMTYGNDSFSLAVDKGTVDAMMSDGTGGGHVSPMAAEIWRTLRPGGIFLLVSHNGGRLALLDHAVAECHGPSATWEPLEVRRCRLSPQATLINILRSKLKGRPISAAFKDPQMMAEAAKETRQAMKQMAFLEAFRLFKARKAKQQAAASGKSSTAVREELEKVPEDEDEDDEPRDPRLQPFCWVYVLRKCVEAA